MAGVTALADDASPYDVAHRLARDGERFPPAAGSDEDGVDLVVVGAGISGLAAAWYYRRRFGEDARILVLDNSRHFGGAARRVELDVDGTRLITFGGASGFTGLRSWNSPIIARFLSEIGIDLASVQASYAHPDLYASLGLESSVFFGEQQRGAGDVLVRGTLVLRDQGQSERSRLAAMLDRFPYGDADRASLVGLWLDGSVGLRQMAAEDRRGYLAHTSYRDFLVGDWGLSAQAASFFDRRTIGIFGSPATHVSSLECCLVGLPGFQGIELPGLRRYAFADEGYVHFPDGLATVARMIVRKLIPGIAPGGTLADVVGAEFDQALLDDPAMAVRIRLQSTVVHIANTAGGVVVDYIGGEGPRRVCARHCVYASWAAMLPHLMPELGDAQRQALRAVVKPPMSYTKVALRNWSTFVQLGIHEVFSPHAFFYKIELPPPMSVGDYRFATDPGEPIAISMVHRPVPAGDFEDYRDEARAAQQALLDSAPATFEAAARDQLDRILGPAGFRSDRDIAAIDVNRWGHTYSPTLNTLCDDIDTQRQAMKLSRTPAGNVTIAGVDSHRFGWAQIAIDAAERAIHELPTGRVELAF